MVGVLLGYSNSITTIYAAVIINYSLNYNIIVKPQGQIIHGSSVTHPHSLQVHCVQCSDLFPPLWHLY